jgi:hypothetical protein
MNDRKDIETRGKTGLFCCDGVATNIGNLISSYVSLELQKCTFVYFQSPAVIAYASFYLNLQPKHNKYIF